MTELEGVEEMLHVSLQEQIKMHQNIMDLRASLRTLMLAAEKHLRWESDDWYLKWAKSDRTSLRKVLDAIDFPLEDK